MVGYAIVGSKLFLNDKHPSPPIKPESQISQREVVTELRAHRKVPKQPAAGVFDSSDFVQVAGKCQLLSQ